MKMFTVDYSFNYENSEKSILFAENTQVAKKMIEEELSPYKYTWVDSLEETKNNRCNVMFIQEIKIPINAKILYTGLYKG